MKKVLVFKQKQGNTQTPLARCNLLPSAIHWNFGPIFKKYYTFFKRYHLSTSKRIKVYDS